MEKNKYEDNEKWVATSGGGLSGGLGNDYKDRQGILGEWEKRNEASEASSDLLCVTNGSIDLHLTHSLSILGFSPFPHMVCRTNYRLNLQLFVGFGMKPEKSKFQIGGLGPSPWGHRHRGILMVGALEKWEGWPPTLSTLPHTLKSKLDVDADGEVREALLLFLNQHPRPIPSFLSRIYIFNSLHPRVLSRIGPGFDV